MSISDFFSSLVSTSALFVPYTSKGPIIIDAPYPPLRAVPVSRPSEPAQEGCPCELSL